MAALDLSAVVPPYTCQVNLQDSATDVRVITLPSYLGAYTVTIGPVYDSGGVASANEADGWCSFSTTLEDDDAAPSAADGAERRLVKSGGTYAFINPDERSVGGSAARKTQVACWGEANGFVEIAIDGVGDEG